MTTPPHTPTRDALTGILPAEILARLPQMGRVMVIGQQGGVTHERIGPVEQVATDGERVSLGGACHDATIAVDQIARVILDTSSVMREKIYPRLDFQDAGGTSHFAIVGMDGLEAFVAPLAEVGRQPQTPKETAVIPDGDRPALADDDPVQPPFQTLFESGVVAGIVFDNGTLRQGWQGQVAALKPAMGFLNVMTADFHLHLKGGGFLPWQSAPGARIAIGADGQPNGLVLQAGCFA